MLSGVIEPAVSINTTDPGNVIVSSQRGLRASTNVGVDLISATTQPFAAVPTQTGPGGDTDTAFDSQGRLFWVNLVSFAGTQRDVVIGAVNPTNGASLAVPVRVPNGGALTDDKPFIAADANPLSPFADNLYVAFDRFGGQVANQQSVFFSRSTDHGLTWSAPLLLSDFDGPNNVVDNGGDDEGFTWPADVKVAPNGDVYVAYHAQPDINDAEVEGGTPANPNGTSGKVFVLRSTDGGQTFPQKTEAFTDGQADVTFNRQSAAGLIPGTDFWMLGSPQPWVLPDPTRPGFVYVVSNDDPDNTHGTGDDGDVVFARSGDNGLNWITSTISSGPANSFQLFPTASIDEFGNIVVAWYDNRRNQMNNGPDGTPGTGDENFLLDVFARYSMDGGLTWSPEFMVNDAALDPDIGTVQRFPPPPADAGAPTTRIGEYFGLDHFGGTAHLAWNGPNPLTGAQTGQQVVYSTFAIKGQLTVTGDDSGAATDDVFNISRMAANTDFIEVRVNGIRQYAGLLEGLTQIDVDGLGGNDTLIIDSSNGLLTFPNGIRFHGGDGFDKLSLLQTGGTTQTSDAYSVGAIPGAGTSIIVGPSGTQTLFFEDLAPVLDLVPAATLTVNATPADNTINYTVSAAGNGLVTVDNFEPIEFANKGVLTINAGVGDDKINLNNTGSPSLLTSITVNAGDGEDKVTTFAGLPTALTFDGGDGNDLLDASGATGPATLIGRTGNDTLIGGSGSDSISGGSGEDLIDGRGGSNTLDGGADNDTILVSGTAGADTITTTHGAGTFDITGGLSAGTNTISGIEAVRIEARDGADQITLNLSAAGGLNYTVLGGNPIGAPGDVLRVNSSATMVVTPGPENDAGSVDAATTTPTNVSYDEIELLIVGGGGGGGINGTNGPDTITIVARDDSYNAAADGVQDFTVSVNTGSEILFLNQPTLTVDALAGSDQVTLRTPAPNLAPWDVDVTVNGGLPAADTDRLIVEVPGAETAIYTPTAFDGGTLDLTSLSSLVTINTTEVVIYDGQGDNDSLTIVGTSGDDTIVHTPGANDQAGTFQINSLLALSYQNLGSGGSLTADGGAGIDTLVYNGTATNDTFTLGSTGDVTLNSRLVLHTAGVEILTLEGLAGDDSVNLSGSGNIVISGQVINLGGTIINSHVETTYLNASGSNDLLTYNGVSGVSENITVSSSGVAGGGQLSVPGETLVIFSGVEQIDVNGNTTETDALTFAGTNAPDTFNINLAAAGTNTDPILQLQNSLGAPLLTLRNYTSFDTLRVLGLDGTDTFNVTTAASTTPTDPNFKGRNLFVDGGQPTGKKKSTDNLNIFYTAPRPRIIHSAATQDPDAGIVDLDYGTARFVVQYDDIEQVVIRKR